MMNSDDILKLMSLLNEFDNFVYGNLGEWDTEPVNPGLNSYYKQVNYKTYLLPRINMDTFHKELQ